MANNKTENMIDAENNATEAKNNKIENKTEADNSTAVSTNGKNTKRYSKVDLDNMTKCLDEKISFKTLMKMDSFRIRVPKYVKDMMKKLKKENEECKCG
ncbi:hypothetical protein TSUD_100690 [Trifolium subterraneum]|uniref:Uncharacterized protein n=1 Tax=Trifolium subterraneum TaxID=3900 RepID=A0A2Z6P767_TRISU|nr:hypothetical protein TSUD_100690 [Trifolium subterraneum]